MSETQEAKPVRKTRRNKVGPEGAVPVGRGATVKLPDGSELALFNVDGKHHAVENACPHRGFSLSDSRLYGGVVECDLHGWRFDVASGDCLTDSACPIKTFEVVVEDGWIYILT